MLIQLWHSFVRAQRRRHVRKQIGRLPSPVDAVVFDFDGVFTDNGVIVNQDGVESVRCDRMDGMGINLLTKAGVRLLVLSKEQNPVVAARCQKLKLECLHGVDDKAPALRAWLEQHHCDIRRTVYLGNDVNDAPCLSIVGCPCVVADAHESVFALAKIVLSKPGGRGAVRELCDMILARMGK